MYNLIKQEIENINIRILKINDEIEIINKRLINLLIEIEYQKKFVKNQDSGKP